MAIHGFEVLDLSETFGHLKGKFLFLVKDYNVNALVLDICVCTVDFNCFN